MNKIKAVFSNKKALFIVVGVILVALLLFLFINRKQILPTDDTGISGGQNPPVVQVAPELKFVKAIPPEGPRETFDVFAQTFFEFSTDVDQNTARVTVIPNLAVKATVYESEKRVLVIEPAKTPWSDGVEYTIIINQGLRGLGGEELRKKVEYKFSNKQPPFFEGGDPVKVK